MARRVFIDSDANGADSEWGGPPCPPAGASRHRLSGDRFVPALPARRAGTPAPLRIPEIYRAAENLLKRAAVAAFLLALLLVQSRAGWADPDQRPARLVLPDVELVDQDGITRRLIPDLVQGRIAVVSFVFTGCTTICSPVGANMGALDRLLEIGRAHV